MPSRNNSSSDEEYCYGVNFVGKTNNLPTTEVKIKKNKRKLLLDTGASVNILDEKTYKDVGSPKMNKKSGP